MNTTPKSTLADSIYYQLRQDIIKQTIACGEKLTLQSLKERFQVSHTPIRQALTRLNEEGLVTYYSNCGVSVVTFTEADIQELFRFCAELDALAVKLCQYTPSYSTLQFELDTLEAKSEQALKENNLSLWESLSEDFHLLFYKYAHNSYLTNAAKIGQAKIALLSNLYNKNETIITVENTHKEIAQAIKNSDFNLASELMRNHTLGDVVFALKALNLV